MEYGLVALWVAAYLSIGALSVPLAATAFSVPRPRRGLRRHDRTRHDRRRRLPRRTPRLRSPGADRGDRASQHTEPPGGWRRSGLPGAPTPRPRPCSFSRFCSSSRSARFRRPSHRFRSPPGRSSSITGCSGACFAGRRSRPRTSWFAGEAVQYYYGGQMLTALLATLTGTRRGSRTTSPWARVLRLARHGCLRPRRRDRRRTRRAAAFASVVGAFFVGLAGNLPHRRRRRRLGVALRARRRDSGCRIRSRLVDSLGVSLLGREPDHRRDDQRVPAVRVAQRRPPRAHDHHPVYPSGRRTVLQLLADSRGGNDASTAAVGRNDACRRLPRRHEHLGFSRRRRARFFDRHVRPSGAGDAATVPVSRASSDARVAR